MNEQFRILVVSAFVLALALRLGSCASAATQGPSASPTVAPPTPRPSEPAMQASTAASSTTPNPDSAAETSKTVCLECHPYDSVIEASRNCVMPSGETSSPHRYINPDNPKDRHGSTGAAGIPECINCHTAHPLPPTDPVDLSKIGVTWCYSACHHQENFTPCSKCHEE